MKTTFIMKGSVLKWIILTWLLQHVDCDIIVYTQTPPKDITEEFRDMPAHFGDSLPLEGLKGFVVRGQPEDGCSSLTKPPLDDNFTGKWVVILARYNCSFEVKIRNAQAAGYDAAIVHNVNSSDLEIMSAKNAVGIRIPSVFVSEETGYLIKENYLYTSLYFVIINSDLPFNINTHLLLPFAIVVGLCLITMVVLMIVKCIKDRRRARRHRLPSRALKKIPTCRYTKGDPYDTCAICLDDYLEGDKLRVLPCAHAYHCKCIDPWLTKNRRVCPVCKRRVMSGSRRTDTSRRPARAAVTTTGSSASDSDEHTPLVSPVREQQTQGGTFEVQDENPFVRAARLVTRRPFLFRSSSQVHQEQNVQQTRQAHSEEREPDFTSYIRQDSDSHNNRPSTERRGDANARVVPFLTGLVRGTNFTRDNNDDCEPLITSSSANEQCAMENEWNINKSKSEQHLASVSCHQDGENGSFSADRDNGEIGVAALPNTEFINSRVNNDMSTSASNHFPV